MPVYGTVGAFKAHLQEQGRDLPADVDAKLPGALVRGTQFVDRSYGMRFQGASVDPEQALEWPRVGVYVNGTLLGPIIPWRVINATYEAAYLELMNPGSLVLNDAPEQRTKRAKAGSAEVEFFDDGASKGGGGAPVVAAIEGLLSSYLKEAGLRDLPAILVV